MVSSGTKDLIVVDLSKGLIGACATAGETMNIHDTYKDPRFDQSNDREFGFTTRSVLCVPVKDEDGEVIGVVQMLSKFMKVMS